VKAEQLVRGWCAGRRERVRFCGETPRIPHNMTFMPKSSL
jgi:hypothetical protein